MLRTNSAFFKAALSHDWREREEGLVTLLEDDPSAFELYVSWLYTKRVASKFSDEEGTKRSQECALLTDCIVLGEKLQDVGFKNALVDCVIAVSTNDGNGNGCCITRPSRVNKIYEHTSPAAPVRRLLVDMWAWYGMPDWFTSREMGQIDYHNEFLLDLGKKLLAVRAKPFINNPCTLGNRAAYHETGSERAKEHSNVPSSENAERNQA